jgi:hypothetical protein
VVMVAPLSKRSVNVKLGEARLHLLERVLGQQLLREYVYYKDIIYILYV